MSEKITTEPSKYTERALSLICRLADKWNCSPSEAQARALDVIAERESNQASRAEDERKAEPQPVAA